MTPHTTLEHALTYANLGLRVIPIRPGSKHPPVAAWQKTATTNPDTITTWWTHTYPNHGIGLVLGTQPDGRHIFAIDLDRHHPQQDGHTTLQHLQQQHDTLPATVTSTTGGNGHHQLYQAPPGHIIRNQRADGGRLGPGIDIRGEGGQIVVAPTIHPTGTPYTWRAGHAPWQHPIAQAPTWLLHLVTEPPTQTNTQTNTTNTPTSDDTPADRLRKTWNWEHELTTNGWTHHHTATNGDTYWTRPGKPTRDGSSAVLHPHGPLVIFTTSIPDHWQQHGTPTADGTGRAYSPFDIYTCIYHNGNASEAARTLNQTHTPNLTTLIRTDEPAPTSDDYDTHLLNQLINWDEFWTQDHSAEDWLVQPVLAARRSHAIYAPGGTGKSLFSLWIAAHLATGQPIFGQPTPARHILYLDYEMTADDLAERLDAIGIHNPDTLHRLHYALLPALPPADSTEGGNAICRLAELCNAEIVILDTFSRAVQGDENDADTVRDFYRLTGSRLKKAGRAFLRIDHAGKDATKGQRGTSAKNDDVDVVWQLTKTDIGIRLKAVKRRMGWIPETVEITIEDQPNLLYDMATRPGVPAGTLECVRLLDELGIDVDMNARPIGQLLREQGHKVSDRVLRAAVKTRRERLENVTVSAAEKRCRGEISNNPPRGTPRSAAANENNEKRPETVTTQQIERGEQKAAALRRATESPAAAAALYKSAAPAGPPLPHPPEE